MFPPTPSGPQAIREDDLRGGIVVFAAGASERGFAGDGAVVGSAGKRASDDSADHVASATSRMSFRPMERPVQVEVGSQRRKKCTYGGSCGAAGVEEARRGGEDDTTGVVLRGCPSCVESVPRRAPPHEAGAASNHVATKAASRFNRVRISVGTSLTCIASMMPEAVTWTP